MAYDPYAFLRQSKPWQAYLQSQNTITGNRPSALANYRNQDNPGVMQSLFAASNPGQAYYGAQNQQGSDQNSNPSTMGQMNQSQPVQQQGQNDPNQSQPQSDNQAYNPYQNQDNDNGGILGTILKMFLGG